MSAVDGVGGASSAEQVEPTQTEAVADQSTESTTLEGQYGETYDATLPQLETPWYDSHAAQLADSLSGGLVSDVAAAGEQVASFIKDQADTIGAASDAVCECLDSSAQSAYDTATTSLRGATSAMTVAASAGNDGEVASAATSVMQSTGVLDTLLTKAKEAADGASDVVSGALDSAEAAVDWVEGAVGGLADTLSPPESPLDAIVGLDKDDSLNVSLGGKIKVAPHAAGGVAGLGFEVEGEVAAKVTQVEGADGQPSYQIEVSGEVGVGGAASAGEGAEADGDLALKGKGTVVLEYASAEEAAAALEQLKGGEFPAGVKSVEVEGTLAADLNGQLGIPEAEEIAGIELGAEVSGSGSVRFEFEPPAVAITQTLAGKVDGRGFAGVGGDGDITASAKIETKVALPEGTTLNDVIADPGAALSSVSVDSLTTTAELKVGSSVGAGALGATVVGVGGDATFTVSGKPLEITQAAAQFVTGDMDGALTSLDDGDNKIAVKIDAYNQVGLRKGKWDLTPLGVGAEVSASAYLENRHTLWEGDATGAEAVALLRKYSD